MPIVRTDELAILADTANKNTTAIDQVEATVTEHKPNVLVRWAPRCPLDVSTCEC